MLLKVLHGKKHWLYHRFSAILFFPLAIWMAFSLSFVPEITHENMVLMGWQNPKLHFTFNFDYDFSATFSAWDSSYFRGLYFYY